MPEAANSLSVVNDDPFGTGGHTHFSDRMKNPGYLTNSARPALQKDEIPEERVISGYSSNLRADNVSDPVTEPQNTVPWHKIRPDQGSEVEGVARHRSCDVWRQNQDVAVASNATANGSVFECARQRNFEIQPNKPQVSDRGCFRFGDATDAKSSSGQRRSCSVFQEQGVNEQKSRARATRGSCIGFREEQPETDLEGNVHHMNRNDGCFGDSYRTGAGEWMTDGQPGGVSSQLRPSTHAEKNRDGYADWGYTSMFRPDRYNLKGSSTSSWSLFGMMREGGARESATKTAKGQSWSSYLRSGSQEGKEGNTGVSKGWSGWMRGGNHADEY